MTPHARTAAQPRGAVLLPLLAGVFVRALPLTMLGPLLPGIAISLGARLADIGWIVATYATGSLIAQPVMGRLADDRGRRRVFLACIALFGAGSLISALATSLPWLVAGRIVQALGAGGVQPVATAIIADRLDPQRQGGALGALYAAFGAGTMAGALLGGSVVAVAGVWALRTSGWLAADLLTYPWHVAFWLNVVLALIASALALSLPADEASATAPPRGYDPIGIMLIGAMCAGLMIAATSTWEIATASCIATAFVIAWFVRHERSARSPLIDPALFASRGPALLYWIALLFGIPSFSLTIYSATFVIAQFHESPVQAGMALFVLATAYVASAIAGGALIGRIGYRPLLICAAVVVAAGVGWLALSASPLTALAAMAVGGIGLGLASAPPNALLLRYVPASRAGSATGVAIMLASTGAVSAPVVISACLANLHGIDAGGALRTAFGVCAVLALGCAALALRLPEPAATSAAVAVEECSGSPDNRRRGARFARR